MARQAPLSMEFSRQEFWSELPFPIPEDLPDPGINPTSPASPAFASKLFTSEPPGKAESMQILIQETEMRRLGSASSSDDNVS